MIKELYDLAMTINEHGANNIKVTHIETEEVYSLAYQYYYGHDTYFSYLAFIKSNGEIDFFTDDLDEDDFEEILESWRFEHRD